MKALQSLSYIKLSWDSLFFKTIRAMILAFVLIENLNKSNNLEVNTTLLIFKRLFSDYVLV